MADESSGLLFQILLDQAAQQDTERGLSNIEQKIGNFDKLASKAAQDVGASWDAMGADFQKFTAKFDERFKLVNGNLVDLQTGTKVAASTLREFNKIDVDAPGQSLEKLNNNLEDTADLAKEAKQQFSQIRAEVAILSQTSSTLQRLGQPLFVGGTAFIAGIALQARSYSKFIEDAGIKGDETATKWIAATAKVKNAQLNLGEASARALLPVYEELANLTEKAAQFAQEHPDLIRAGVNLAAVAATVGAISIAVSRGIRLYADIKYLTATGLFGSKVDEFVGGVAAFNTGSAVGNAGRNAATGSGTIAGIAKSASLIAIGVVIAKALVDAVNNALVGTKFGNAIDEAQKKAAEGGGGYPGINRYARATEEVDKAASDASQSADKLAGGLRDFQNEADLAQATDAFISYRQQEAQAEQQYSQQRASLVQQGLEQINQIEANYVKQRAQLIAQYEQSSANALASFNFQQAQAASQFAQQQAQAEQQHQENRKKAQESYQKETERAAKDHQKALQKLEEEHNDKVRDLVAARDALGLSREKRDYERRKRDLEENYSEEKKRRQEDYRQRLREMDEQFAKERAQRQADFEFRQQQAAEQFAFQQAQAKAQFEERLKQLDAQHNEELSKARQQQAEKLRELELAYRQEQVTRRNAFLDILRDLNANLLNEENLRNQYYARMQADLVNFLQSTAAGVSNGSNLPGYQSGGYTPEGPIRTHRGEYVLDPQSTSSLEKLVGGRLTRDSIQNFAQGGGSTTVNMQFPGGMITRTILNEALDKNTAKLLKNLTKGLVRA